MRAGTSENYTRRNRVREYTTFYGLVNYTLLMIPCTASYRKEVKSPTTGGCPRAELKSSGIVRRECEGKCPTLSVNYCRFMTVVTVP